MIGLSLQDVELPLTQPVNTARGPITTRVGVVVKVTDGIHTGYGEALPLPGWPGHDLATTRHVLADAVARLENTHHLDALAEAAEELTDPLAAAALDTARLDLAGHRQGCPVATLLAAPNDPGTTVAANALLGGADIAALADSAASARTAGFPVAKLKVGDDVANDIERTRVAATEFAGPLRLDANGGWTIAETTEFAGKVSDLAIDYLEEPVSSFADMAELMANPDRRHALRLAFDEMAHTAAARQRVVDERLADVLVTKPVWNGPLAHTVELAEQAAAANIDLVVTSAIDSTIGLSAALHVAAAIPNTTPAGLATGHLVEPILGTAPLALNGQIATPTGGGLGVAVTLVRW